MPSTDVGTQAGILYLVLAQRKWQRRGLIELLMLPSADQNSRKAQAKRATCTSAETDDDVQRQAHFECAGLPAAASACPWQSSAGWIPMWLAEIIVAIDVIFFLFRLNPNLNLNHDGNPSERGWG